VSEFGSSLEYHDRMVTAGESTQIAYP
jgi:hypothetical protein